MKGIIIYKSKYGSTKQYAKWLQESTGFDMFNVSKCPNNLDSYDTIVLGCSIHGGSISLKPFLMKNWESLKGKNILIMLTSGAEDKEFIQQVVEKNLPVEISKKVSVYPVGGRYILDKMSFLDRSIIKTVAYFSKNPDVKKGMLTERDDVTKSNLDDLINAIV